MTDCLARYESIKDTAWKALALGDLEGGLAVLDEGLVWARAEASTTLVDRMLCNRASFLIELGEGESVKGELKKILLKSADDENRFLASYTLARAYDIDGETDKALQFARTAFRHSGTLGDDQRGAIHNLLGNLLIVQNDFEGAHTELEQALACFPQGDSVRRAYCLDSIGYCHAIGNRFKKAFGCLFESVRLGRRLHARPVEATALLSLAYTYLQDGRPERALRHASRSLVLAESLHDRVGLKYGLFILGEAHKQCGNPLLAHDCFRRLQQEFYPESSAVPEMLLFLNVANLVNLKG